MNLIKRIQNKMRRMRLKPSLAGGEGLIIHIGQHKTMTAYFNKILYNLCVDFDWEFRKYFNEAEYLANVHHIGKAGKIEIVCCYNFSPDPDLIAVPFRGSNIIRDPRDLLVSGYRYHLWTNEAWACAVMVEELWERLHLKGRFPGIPDERLKAMSYKELLNELGETDGYLLELDLRKKHFDAMGAWNYTDGRFINVKYESLFGHETSEFERIFRHYGFSEGMIVHGLKYVRDFSFDSMVEKQAAGPEMHASKGVVSQWVQSLNATVIDAFNERHAGMLKNLGYE